MGITPPVSSWLTVLTELPHRAHHPPQGIHWVYSLVWLKMAENRDWLLLYVSILFLLQNQKGEYFFRLHCKTSRWFFSLNSMRTFCQFLLTCCEVISQWQSKWSYLINHAFCHLFWQINNILVPNIMYEWMKIASKNLGLISPQKSKTRTDIQRDLLAL